MEGNFDLRDFDRTFGTDSASSFAEKTHDDMDFYNNPSYQLECTRIMNEAMRRGEDVLHLDNGDLISTGTCYLTNHFTWDSATKKMALAKQSETKQKLMNYETSGLNSNSDADINNNDDYINSIEEIITKALAEGKDIMQLENGDVVVSETIIKTNRYAWNADIEMMVQQ